jgi:DNA primase
MIDQLTIDRIYETAQITEVVQDFVSLKRRGVNYIGNCPFHSEKTPSFIVSPSKGIYKCFGCGKGGNSVNFIMEHESLSYYEGLKYLAKKYNIEVVEKETSAEEKAQQNERESLILITEFAAKYFNGLLHNHTEGRSVGLAYFKERGIRDDMIEQFQLGYALEKRDAFTDNAKKSGYKLDYLVKTGLSIDKEGYQFDRFAGRVIFPIHGLSGKVIGFGGRILKTDKNTAKYLNSPESDIYHKSRILYGMFQAKRGIVQHDKCYLVEGYTDVISMHQAGIDNVVASSGTSLTDDQIRLIKRFTNNVTILYDGDAAGIKASIRGIDMVLEQGLNVKVLLFPDGEDPDSFAQKHSSTEVLEFIKKNETDFVLFKTRLLLSEAKTDPVKRATLITDIVRSIAIIPDTIIRSVYIKECATILETDERILYSEINKIRRTKFEQQYQTKLPDAPFEHNKPHKPEKTGALEGDVYEREIVRLLLNYGNHILFHNVWDNDGSDPWIITVGHYLISEIESDELELANPLYKQIFDEYAHLQNKDSEVDQKYFINHPDKDVSSLAADLLTKNYGLSKIWKKKDAAIIETEDMKLPDLVPGIMLDYKSRKVLSLLRSAQLQLLTAQQNNDLEKIEETQQRIMVLNGFKKTMSENLGRRTILH